MATKYETIYDMFLKMIERDRKFFSYINVSPSQAASITEERCRSLLKEACGRITLECQPTINFSDMSEDDDYFDIELTSQERYLIASVMYERYLARDIAYLKNISVNYAPTDVRVFDPSNWRSTFLAMYDRVCADNRKYIEEYKYRDRDNGGYIGIDYSTLNIDDV